MSSLALSHRLAASTKLQDVTSNLDYLQHLLATKLMRQTNGMMNQIQRAWKRKETVANTKCVSDSCRSLFPSLYFQLLSFKKTKLFFFFFCSNKLSFWYHILLYGLL
ncbi:BnaA03g59950D [Brassica napus]|uniref:BnaA03g59950D protein n=1 Tax=Brassica napus TaxID=3708 RepID=A0A078GHP2_BRANA|nr:BnaA03g59950D [Brassica napus]